ncbi:ligase-associated DNA damage response endonuclease PdeM [Limimaricola sp. G21655-S1]|uniref:ligase-associated DNA damage response endonuclease PdeM n=1 Tax=Limimaricola sp. G21655-S1 TaxID=3014768 RepID=UPI0022B071E5|nr:ligase-associated DNA damage response endonuclease PdeM [Limimaricola sp. G21655-S1]MCZ4261029.1 ligase-associated DNA damage response endonuclease PdeM [Limimaricola sp. G21655-S1]
MNGIEIPFQGETLCALGSGALHWAARDLLIVSDLHLGKSERIARRRGTMLPPYETRATLERLEADLLETGAGGVLCLGDSFDDLDAANGLDDEDRAHLVSLIEGRVWHWVEGNHDPGPAGLPGEHHAELVIGPLVFRHIAEVGARGELSGHYHPKFGLPGCGGTRPCFLFDADRMILPAYGAYTGGMPATAPEFAALIGSPAFAVLTGTKPLLVPYPGRKGTGRGRRRF